MCGCYRWRRASICLSPTQTPVRETSSCPCNSFSYNLQKALFQKVRATKARRWRPLGSSKHHHHAQASGLRRQLAQTERLRRTSFFYRSSSKYRGSASAEPSTFRAFQFPPFLPFQNQHASCTSGLRRSLPLETLSPKRVSNDHAQIPFPGEHY